ncbi:MAG: ERF family protein [Pseudomonadota bacterium]
MNKSESIAGLAAALAAAQGVMKGALKDSANPFFKSRYADLASVVEAIRAAFSANGLSYIQTVEPSDKDEVRVETTLLHSSGEWISCGVLSLPVSKIDAQGYGSALTYARRYSLSAAVGVAPEDDDGNAASLAKPKPTMDCTDHISAFHSAATLDDLQTAFKTAYKAAQTLQDSMAMATLTNAKNKRKAELAVA